MTLFETSRLDPLPQALSDGVLWAVDRRSFQSLLVGSMACKRQKYEGILGKMHIFRDLSPGAVSVIADCLTRETFQSGVCIIQEGEELQSDAKFYVVEKGTINCYKTFDVLLPPLPKMPETACHFREIENW